MSDKRRSVPGRLILMVLLLAAAALVSVTRAPAEELESGSRERPGLIRSEQTASGLNTAPANMAALTAADTNTADRALNVSDQRAKELERLVRQDCGSCHGMTLKGGLGPDLRPEILDGSDPETLALIVLDGVPDSAMPPWRPLLSEADANWIARYLLKGENP
ncbi:c-type cytochrome [Rhodovibrionaceae bacterium A322]